MKHTKRSIFILTTVLVLSLLFAVNVFATQPEHVEGYVPLSTYMPGPPGGITVYGVCDPYLVGMVAQPAETPGKVVHGSFTAGNLEACEYHTEKSGTCEITFLPVEEFMNPDSKLGRGVVGRCTGDLRGLHGTYKIHYDFTYDAWYHFDP